MVSWRSHVVAVMRHHRPALVGEQQRCRRRGRCCPGRRSCRARCSARRGRRRCRGGSRRPGCPRGRRCCSVPPGSTTRAHGRTGVDDLVVDDAPVIAGRPRASSARTPRCCRNARSASGVADQSGVVARGRRGRVHAVTRSGGRPMYSGRGIEHVRRVRDDDEHGQLGAQLDVRAGARPACRRSASAPSVVDAHALEEVDVGHDVAAVEPGLASATANRSRAFGWRAVHAAARRTSRSLRAGVDAPHSASWRAAGVGDDRQQHAAHVGEQQRARAEVGLPLHLHGVGHVEPLDRAARALYTSRLAQASPSRSVSRTRAPRASDRAASPAGRR